MGEAKRRRDAAYRDGPWPGSEGRCPQCFGTEVDTKTVPGQPEIGTGKFYADRLTVCVKCEIIWEPIDEANIWDRDSPTCSGKEPCDNCAFRPGSHEQSNIEEWKKTMASLKAGGSFYCHKGVPLDPGGEYGFAYSKDRRKLRICRGYLNALGKWWKKDGVAA
jgi:hypothetical protein